MVMPEVHRRRNDLEGPATYRDVPFSEKIANAANLSPEGPSLRVADFMSRHGKMAAEMQAIAPQHEYTAVAVSSGQLEKTPDGITTLISDVRGLEGVNSYSFDLGFVRYGVKDIDRSEQLDALESMGRALKDGGTLVIADMVAPEGTKDWINEHHRQKQLFEGRKIERDGMCHIPTQEEWMTLLADSGFDASVSDIYVSRVKTTDWVNGLQFGTDIEEANAKRAEMDRLILQAPDEAKAAFNIREEEGLVKVDYPVIIIRAIKRASRIDAQSPHELAESGPVVILSNE